MRILWHSNAPWCPTGYGAQTALFAPLLAGLGHEVAISAFHGLQGSPTQWNGLPVYPGGRENWGLDVLAGHYRHWRADLCITLMDTWCLNPLAMADTNMRLACWTPVDCDPLGSADQAALDAAKAVPVAVSRHGERVMLDAGLAARYVPHGVDTSVFQPPADRAALRREMGLASKFVVGINAANRDHSRKGFPEQFRAFAEFAKGCPDAILLVHTVAENSDHGGLDLRELAATLGITSRVRFCQQYEYLAGLLGQEALASWYGALDVLSNCSWGEGFGIPVLEAQACGTPVIVTNHSAMTELRGPGWQIPGEPFWHVLHQAWWAKPRVSEIVRAYQKARLDAGNRRARAREFALAYDAKRILEEHWQPLMESLTD